ncbi:MAG: twin-arginine translocase subunit TatB [Alphaproteobacteria bacterium]|nr:twin-arginine translocase subunit TatB [Alphaproteobacteria bacterium]
MLDIGWSEFLVIIVVILIVVGPKDLPRILRTFGQWSGKAKSYARDFQRTIEEAADENELAAIRKEIEVANRELAEVSKTTVNLDTGVKMDDGPLDPQAAQFGGTKPASAPAVPAATMAAPEVTTTSEPAKPV